MQSAFKCLVVGPQGAGKSLLLKKLKALNGKLPSRRCSRDHAGSACDREILATIPTVGATVEELKLTPKVTCTLKEYGGCMAPVWSTAYADSDVVIYVIDASNCTQVSTATVLLLEALGERELREKPFLIFFNKLDCECPMSLVELQSVMRMGDIRSHATQPVSVVEGNCATGQALPAVLQWLEQQHSTVRTK